MPSYLCGAKNKYPGRKYCHHPVTGPGLRCPDHKGQQSIFAPEGGKTTSPPRRGVSRQQAPAPVRRPSPPPPPRRSYELKKKQRDRIDDLVAGLSADVLVNGWPEAIATRSVDCLDEKAWDRLFKGRRARDCKALADMAKALLEGKKQLHEATGRFTGRVAKAFGAEPIEEAVVRELAKRIPLPVID